MDEDIMVHLDRASMNRVHEELEKLNIATDIINKLEVQLDEARTMFRQIQSSWSQRLESLAKKLGSCIEKSRPYFEARLKARHIQEEAHKAALRFERANSMHEVAKKQVALSQESLERSKQQGQTQVDAACLEVLNHHVQRVNEAEAERLKAEDEHRRVSGLVADASERVRSLEKELGRNIKKAQIYFENRAEFTKVLEDQKGLIERIEVEIKQKKRDYTTSLRCLEEISEKIHEERKKRGINYAPEESFDEEVFVSIRGKTQTEEEEAAEVENIVSAQLSPGAQVIVDEVRRHSISPTTDPRKDVRTFSEPAETQASGGRRRSRQPQKNELILLPGTLPTDEFGIEWFPDERKLRAFSYPPELDDDHLQYRTAPEGIRVTPGTSPSHSSSSEKQTKQHLSIDQFSIPATPNSATSSSAAEPDTVSVSSTGSASVAPSVRDDMLVCHEDIIKEIDSSAQRAKRMSQLETSTKLKAHQRSISDVVVEESLKLEGI